MGHGAGHGAGHGVGHGVCHSGYVIRELEGYVIRELDTAQFDLEMRGRAEADLHRECDRGEGARLGTRASEGEFRSESDKA